MSQFTALMTILLAFFILLQTMSKIKESGFREGIGDVKDAFGLEGGLGIFNFIVFGKGGTRVPNPSNAGKDEFQGVHENLVKSGGGSGNTDAKVENLSPDKYFVVPINYDFAPGSAKIPEKMRAYLKNVGMGFAFFNYKINIKCYSHYFGDNERDRELAIRRAVNIMHFLHGVCWVPYSIMQATGYSSAKFLDIGTEGKEKKQQSFFYIFMKDGNKKNKQGG